MTKKKIKVDKTDEQSVKPEADVKEPDVVEEPDVAVDSDNIDASEQPEDAPQKGKFTKFKEAAEKTIKKAVEPAEPKEPLEEQLLRLRADFDNFRKRTQRERAELFQRANEDIMEELLPVMDHLELALKAADEHGADESFVDGVKLVVEQMVTTLGRFGLKPIEAEGQDFDHNLHEAISHLPSEEVPADKVMAQVRKGYLLGSKLLRASQVVVSGGSADESKGE